MSFTGSSAMFQCGGHNPPKGCRDSWKLTGLSLLLQERGEYVKVLGT